MNEIILLYRISIASEISSEWDMNIIELGFGP